MDDSVAVAQFLDAPTAELLRGYLQSHGIEAAVDGYHAAALAGGSSPMLGSGARLTVPAAQARRARDLVRRWEAAGPACPHCGSTRLVGVERKPRRGSPWSTIASWFDLTPPSSDRVCLDCDRRSDMDDLVYGPGAAGSDPAA